MKIQIEDEIVTITISKTETISFHISSIKEFSNALMIIRCMEERDSLKSVLIEYG